MSREFKFRMWDLTQKQMIQSGFLIDCQGGIPAQILDEWGHSFVLMEWTGLTDCKSVDIYERDLLRIHRHEKSNFYDDLIIEVQWDDRQLRWSVKGNIGSDGRSRALKEWAGTGRYYRCEKIGNVFEHSHLLEADGPH